MQVQKINGPKKKLGHSTSTQQRADMKCPKIAENWNCRILENM